MLENIKHNIAVSKRIHSQRKEAFNKAKETQDKINKEQKELHKYQMKYQGYGILSSRFEKMLKLFAIIMLLSTVGLNKWFLSGKFPKQFNSLIDLFGRIKNVFKPDKNLPLKLFNDRLNNHVLTCTKGELECLTEIKGSHTLGSFLENFNKKVLKKGREIYSIKLDEKNKNIVIINVQEPIRLKTKDMTNAQEPIRLKAKDSKTATRLRIIKKNGKAKITRKSKESPVYIQHEIRFKFDKNLTREQQKFLSDSELCGFNTSGKLFKEFRTIFLPKQEKGSETIGPEDFKKFIKRFYTESVDGKITEIKTTPLDNGIVEIKYSLNGKDIARTPKTIVITKKPTQDELKILEQLCDENTKFDFGTLSEMHEKLSQENLRNMIEKMFNKTLEVNEGELYQAFTQKGIIIPVNEKENHIIAPYKGRLFAGYIQSDNSGKYSLNSYFPILHNSDEHNHLIKEINKQKDLKLFHMPLLQGMQDKLTYKTIRESTSNICKQIAMPVTIGISIPSDIIEIYEGIKLRKEVSKEIKEENERKKFNASLYLIKNQAKNSNFSDMI